VCGRRKADNQSDGVHGSSLLPRLKLLFLGLEIIHILWKGITSSVLGEAAVEGCHVVVEGQINRKEPRYQHFHPILDAATAGCWRCGERRGVFGGE
jgi:hypothetical protein